MSLNSRITALIIYEYLITVGAEADLFLTKRISGATALFLSNRYLMLVFQLSNFRTIFPFTLLVSFTLIELYARRLNDPNRGRVA